MTAEIAVLNKSAVALAADSAVTIGRPPNSKIYNTVNKIFELSAHHPVGMMVYGRLDFLGLPIETLIKVYRAKLGSKSFDHIGGYRDDFINYLKNDVECLDADQEESAGTIFFDILSKGDKEIQSLILDDIRKRSKYLVSKENTIAQKYFRDKIAVLKSLSFAVGFNTKKFPEKHRKIFDAMVNRCISCFTPTAQTRHLIEEYAGYFIAKNILSDFRTGIVIVGFGDKELCPTLECFEMDGILDDKFKHIHKPEIDIQKSGIQADILGFAQDDMMKSFINGIDPAIKTYFDGIIKKSIRDSSLEILKSMLKDDDKAKAALQSLLPTLDGIADDVTKKADAYITKKSSKPIRDMIRSMPKQELAMLASSLIEITSLKRKVTREQETVGGEVDVAIISKSEGFVWVKRKHYFPAELNTRFFERNYRTLRETSNAQSKP